MGATVRSVPSKAWGSHVPCGARTSTQRMGRGGSPECYHTAVADAISTFRAALLY